MIKQIDNSQIEQQIRDFIAKNLLYSQNGFPYPDDASFLKEGIIDSLGVMELVEFIQNSFGVKVEQSEVTPDHFDSVNQLGAYVQWKQARAVADSATLTDGSEVDTSIAPTVPTPAVVVELP